MQCWIENKSLLELQLGVSRDELYFVWSSVKNTLVTHYEAKHATRATPLTPFASLLVTLHWLKHYPTDKLLAEMVDVAPSTIQEHLQHTIHSLFLTIVPQCFSDYHMPHRGFVDGCLAKVRLVVDSTWITLPHQHDETERKQCYHHKSPTKQALKWQLCTTTTGEPWHISDVVLGSKADVTLLRESGLLDLLGDETLVVGDKGYQGEAQVVTPRKKPRGGEVTKEQKADNKIIGGKRVVVENTFHQFKEWAVLGHEYRGEWRGDAALKRASEIVHVIGALVKRRLEKHPLRAHAKATVS